MSLLNKTWKNLMTVGLAAGICFTGAQTPDEKPHAPEPERQLETPEEIRKNTLAEEGARNRDLPKTPWKSSGKIVVTGATSITNMDTGLEAKGSAFVEREPTLDFPVGLKLGFSTSSSRHFLGHKISGVKGGNDLTKFNFKENAFYGAAVVPFTKNPKGPYLSLGRFSGYVGYGKSDDYKIWFLGGLPTNEFPSHHTGGFIYYPVNEQLTLKGYLVTGWKETFHDDNKDFSGGFLVRYVPVKKIALGFAYYGGKEGSTKNPKDPKEPTYGQIKFLKPGSTQVNLGSGYIQYELNNKWTYALEGYYGKAKAPNASKWCGGGIFAYHQYNEQWQVGGSLETTKEKGGFITKKPFPSARANYIAVGAKTSMTKHSTTMGEVRYTWANQPLFEKKKGKWDFNLVQTFGFQFSRVNFK